MDPKSWIICKVEIALMGSEKNWFLVCYDVRSPKRWAKVYKKLKGRGEHIQLSIFRVYQTKIQLEALKLELQKCMEDEDDLLIIRLCDGCAQKVIDTRGEKKWKEPVSLFEII